MARSGLRFGGLHRLLTALSAVAALTVASRLAPLGRGYALPHQALRWVDLGTLLVWPPVNVAVSYGLLRWTQRGARTPRSVGLLFLGGTYLLAAGYGNHAVTNYLHACLRDAVPGPDTADEGDATPTPVERTGGRGTVLERVREIVVFHDERLSHLLFFTGSACVDLALVLAQAAHPRRGAYTAGDFSLVWANAAVIAAGICLNSALTGARTLTPATAVVAAAGLGAWLRGWLRGQTVPVATYLGLAYGMATAGMAGMALAAALRAGRRPGPARPAENGGTGSAEPPAEPPGAPRGTVAAGRAVRT